MDLSDWCVLVTEQEMDSGMQHFSKKDMDGSNSHRSPAQSKIHHIVNGHVVRPGMKPNRPQTVTAVPEQLEEAYTYLA